ncbi:hypothetical protein LAZ67_16001184 [Cordylochernes scorpioides]|uniref:RRM domain-containing protein n=1 Tax=Cordylochernes scorpioides TaxID=51811 RepID=A0ABY6LC34_9ARAC|nr:hypothetical protein LAZ67_16001184 [Cordylochernes scorpioides]
MPCRTKIFVGRLPDGCKNGELQALFEKYGTVTECDVINKYGFVHMKSSEEADAAIKALHNSSFMGSNITVEQSHSKLHLEPGAPGRARGDQLSNGYQPSLGPRNGFGPRGGFMNGGGGLWWTPLTLAIEADTKAHPVIRTTKGTGSAPDLTRWHMSAEAHLCRRLHPKGMICTAADPLPPDDLYSRRPSYEYGSGYDYDRHHPALPSDYLYSRRSPPW